MSTLLSRVNFSELYAGYFYKMAFNLPVLSAVYCTTQTGRETEAMMSWIATALLYPLNVYKVSLQVAASELSTLKIKNPKDSITIRHLYRGFIPFMAMNMAVGWSLRPLFSADKL